MEFCLYHGTLVLIELNVLDMISPSTFTHTETAVREFYYVTVSCSECNLDGVDDVEFLILADYTPRTSQSGSNLLLTLSFIIAAAIVFGIFSLGSNQPSQKPSQRPAQSSNQTSNSQQIVQNITYNIQDSVISGDLDTSISNEDRAS